MVFIQLIHRPTGGKYKLHKTQTLPNLRLPIVPNLSSSHCLLVLHAVAIKDKEALSRLAAAAAVADAAASLIKSLSSLLLSLSLSRRDDRRGLDRRRQIGGVPRFHA